MNLLLNASNLSHGGGFTVAISLIRSLAKSRPDDHIYVIHPAMTAYKALAECTQVTLLPVTRLFNTSYLEKLKYNQFIFPRWCRKYKIDKVVSLGNVAFPCHRLPQLLYIQIPHIVYPESVAWRRMDWKSFVRNSLMDQYIAFYMRHATSFAVQTDVMKARLSNRFDLAPSRISILPNAAYDGEAVPVNGMLSATGTLHLLFLSKYYPHKNFECLLPLATLIRQKKLPVRITITIDKNEGEGAARLLSALEESQADQVITNIGPVPLTEIGAVISAHDGLFLPSLMESFSGVYVEALKFNRLIFTSHLDFATALLGDAAFYFDPLQPEQTVNVLQQALQHPEIRTEKLAQGRVLAAQMPGWDEIGARFSQLIDTFV